MRQWLSSQLHFPVVKSSKYCWPLFLQNPPLKIYLRKYTFFRNKYNYIMQKNVLFSWTNIDFILLISLFKASFSFVKELIFIIRYEFGINCKVVSSSVKSIAPLYCIIRLLFIFMILFFPMEKGTFHFSSRKMAGFNFWKKGMFQFS